VERPATAGGVTNCSRECPVVYPDAQSQARKGPDSLGARSGRLTVDRKTADHQRTNSIIFAVIERNENTISGWCDINVINRRHPYSTTIHEMNRERDKWPRGDEFLNVVDHAAE
jgi:hypothetical protein